MRMRGAIESDEVYVTAGLKGRNSSGGSRGLVESLGREA